jgi:hypothetical protein
MMAVSIASTGAPEIEADAGAMSAVVAPMVMSIRAPMNLFRRRCSSAAIEASQTGGGGVGGSKMSDEPKSGGCKEDV